MVKIRLAVIEDIPKIMQFISDNWKQDHILASNRSFFEWMYVDGEQCNFIIAEDMQKGKIYGIDGFNRYNSSEVPDIAGSMWKVIKNDNPALGIEMGEVAGQLIPHRWFMGPGLSPRACKLEKLKGGIVDSLRHYYILNEENKEFKIACIKHKNPILYHKDTNQLLKIMNSDDINFILKDNLLQMKVPFKDKKYIQHRYFEHPIYSYQIYAVKRKDGTSDSILVGREVGCSGSKIFKIVDYIGESEDLKDCSWSLYNLLHEENYEYIDFYCYGIDDAILRQAGFTLREKNDENIIPNYFEPFEKKNVEIYFVTGTLEEFYMYRGDGDQDRPS